MDKTILIVEDTYGNHLRILASSIISYVQEPSAAIFTSISVGDKFSITVKTPVEVIDTFLWNNGYKIVKLPDSLQDKE